MFRFLLACVLVCGAAAGRVQNLTSEEKSANICKLCTSVKCFFKDQTNRMSSTKFAVKSMGKMVCYIPGKLTRQVNLSDARVGHRTVTLPKIISQYEGYFLMSDLARTSICHYSDPNVALCIQRVAEQARHLLAQGVPSLNIQPLEPLRIPSIRLRQHHMPKKGFKYDAWLSDVMLKGITNYTFNNLE